MKQFINNILDFGVKESQPLPEQRLVRTTNLLNLVAIILVFFSLVNIIALRGEFSEIPVFSILALAVVSLLLSKYGHNKIAFLLFTVYVNLSIFFFCLYHPFETENYVYYFPVIVSVVLLTNPTRSDMFSLVHIFVCVIFFVGTFTIKIDNFGIALEPEQIRFLRVFNIISAACITALLSFLLTRIISRQNREITDQNTDLLRTKEEVNASLKEKEVLLAELHHRVKNNLAIISGLLNLQDDATNNTEAKDIIRDSKTRIMSMALVHRMLYENAELKNLDLAKYTSELIFELFNSYDLTKKVNIRQEYDKVILPVSKSIPLGLILNEIVTNSIKYVFKSKRKTNGEFYISIRQKENLVTMIVKDDGPGFPPEFNPEAENLSLGIYLIKSLTEQIDGTVRFSNDAGAKIEVNFDLQ